jgi:hypothetical protein
LFLQYSSSGSPGKIHVSEATAKLLSQNGKGSWVTQRTEMVNVKGKGSIQTFWLNTQGNKHASESCGSSRDETNSVNAIDAIRYDDAARKERNVEWICQVLQYRIQNVLRTIPDDLKQSSGQRVFFPAAGSIPLAEVAEIVPLSSNRDATKRSTESSCDCELDECVQAELRSFVYEVAETYQSNPFHNFEHACHVTMSVNKLLSRVVPNNINSINNDTSSSNDGATILSFTNEILDPLAQLATIFAAVIHDADHRGKNIF